MRNEDIPRAQCTVYQEAENLQDHDDLVKAQKKILGASYYM